MAVLKAADVHWMIENGLHWVLDMIFRDDEYRVRADNAPFNLAIVKHSALNVLRTGKSARGRLDAVQPRRRAPVAWQGYAEADFVNVGPTQSSSPAISRSARGID